MSDRFIAHMLAANIRLEQGVVDRLFNAETVTIFRDDGVLRS